MERTRQVLETLRVFFGSILVWRGFFLTGGPLSAPIYKICTLLSTAFVDKIGAARTPPARKPLPDVVFRGAARFP
jgi:hypothetical protein